MTLFFLAQATSRYIPSDGTDNPMAYFTLVLGLVLGFILWWVTHDCDGPDDWRPEPGGWTPPDVMPDPDSGDLRAGPWDIDDELKRLIERAAKKEKAGVG